MAPDHIDARLMFSSFLEAVGSKSEAIEVLKGNNDLKLLKKRFELAREKSKQRLSFIVTFVDRFLKSYH